VLQERQYERVGGTTTLRADVRLIAATNRNLEQAVATGHFREDLYYRLAVFPIHLPPLRERGADVLLLAEHFVRELGARMGRSNADLSGDARELLLAHSWPGNIRELQNAIERALILAPGHLISAEHLGIVARPRRDVPTPVATAPATAAEDPIMTIDEQQKGMIVEALKRTRGHKARAADLLGLTRFQLYGRLKRYQIDVRLH
jgi:Nif-specific regulatory protein